MKTKILALFLLAGSAVFAQPRVGFGFGVSFGGGGYYAPPPPAPLVSYSTGYYGGAYARPGYSWVGGYWYPAGPRYYWHGGYWARPPYAGARWYGPRYYGHRYYPGYWRR